jgi:hypothetical protein
VYTYLLNYVSRPMQKEGRFLMRNYKLMFYYTLMLKAFLKGRWKTGGAFFYNLSRFDNIFLLTTAFIRNKVLHGDPFPAHLIFKQTPATDQS